MPFENTEGVEQSQNLDDAPILEPLFPDSSIAPRTGQVERGEPDQGGQEQTDETDPTSKPAAPRKAGVQARIDRLIRRTHEADRENDVLRQQIALLSNQVATTQAEIRGLLTQRAVNRAAPASGSTDPFAESGPATPPPQTADAPDVREIVRSEIAPIVNLFRTSAAQATLLQQQNAAMAEAIQEYPELGDPNSAERKAFNALYAGREDIRKLPDAPAILSTMVRGIMADQRRGEQLQAQRKRSAGIVSPTPQAADVPAGKADAKQVASLVAQAKENMRNGVATHADYRTIRLARAQGYMR